jgi:2,3-bisphosphoglycerate-independent phosphoglycerate mutase
MVFLDGVGIGRRDPESNPFMVASLPNFSQIVGDKMIHMRDARRSTALSSVVPLNATLGVPGLPQSGTGQTALLTGLNAPRIVGKHFGPYPYSSLKPILAEHSLFRKLTAAGKCVFYANAFPRQYFAHLDSTKSRATAITLSWLMSDHKLNDSETLAAGNALSSDITNQRWHNLGYSQMPIISPDGAGKRLVQFSEKYEFVLFEYYFTDHAGHSQSMNEAISVLEMLDRFLGGMLDALDRHSMLLIVVSDHGNLEDLSTKSHTRNPVPLIAVGQRHKAITTGAKNLTHVAPAILNVLT